MKRILRLVDVEKVQHWNSRGHFFAAAADRDSTPSPIDFTDFDVAELGSNQVRTFNIRNFGAAPVELGSR